MNILLFTADDMNGDTPGCCGGPAEATPRLDRLAAEGVLFRRAHVPIAVCQPSRSAMMTGRWPHRNGALGFSPIRDDVPVLTDLLRAQGYRVGILGKVEHLTPIERFRWEVADTYRELGAGRDPARYATAARRFISAHGDVDRPWFLMANAHDPHRPFHGSDQEAAMFPAELRERIPAPSHVFKSGDWPVPEFLPDVPEVRQEVAEYLSSSRRCDDVLAAVLAVLDETGQADRTVVVFLSDNGMAFPFAKSNCYLHSTRTPLVVRWPGRMAGGRADEEHFVSGLDLFPTLCEAAGAAIPEGTDGRSLVPLLDGGSEAGRDAVFTVFHETASRQQFEMRCVQDGRHGYIWNAWSDGSTRYQAENMTGRTWPALAASDAARAEFYLHRVPEELYRFDEDPDALVNLAADPAHAADLARLRSALAAWMAETGDPLADRYRSVST